MSGRQLRNNVNNKAPWVDRGWGDPDPELFVDFGPDNWEPLGSTVVLRNLKPELAEYTPEIKIPEHIISYKVK